MPTRRRRPHDPPRWIAPAREIWFITICCQPHGDNQLAQPEVAAAVIETVVHRQQRGDWWPHVFLLMTDHLHALLSFPPDGPGMVRIITEWKRWTARTHRIQWQRDFFDHRLRCEESLREKADYIMQNPVRAGMVDQWEDWPYRWSAPLP